MEVIYKTLFYISAFIIFWAMIGYSMSLKIIEKLYKNRELVKDYNLKPSVTVMVVAHNEDKVIEDKLNNIIDLKYPKDRIEFLIVSDNSTDSTNMIVKNFALDHQSLKIRLFEVNERKGKTNAQNEAQKQVDTEFLVMTDANSMLDANSIIELMATFTSPQISYVSGRLAISNSDCAATSSAESNYWEKDLTIREIESKIQTITAGNGALYACRNDDYFDIEPIRCHDSEMPLQFSLKKKRAICNHDAIAYEKAGELMEDEFNRKIRMNREILRLILPDIRILNIFKYKWFSYFYFGHRTCRYLLWSSHFFVFICSFVLFPDSVFYRCALLFQGLFFLTAYMWKKRWIRGNLFKMIYYYTITIFSQWVGVYNILSGNAKSFWEKAESTR